MISVIIPILDEEENLKKLITRLNLVLKENQTSFEIIAVDDGSKDNSLKILKSLINEYEFLKVVTFKINQGQTAAIMAGIEYSSGEIIIPIDADLQNDPKDITKLLKKIKSRL